MIEYFGKCNETVFLKGKPHFHGFKLYTIVDYHRVLLGFIWASRGFHMSVIDIFTELIQFIRPKSKIYADRFYGHLSTAVLLIEKDHTFIMCVYNQEDPSIL